LDQLTTTGYQGKILDLICNLNGSKELIKFQNKEKWLLVQIKKRNAFDIGNFSFLKMPGLNFEVD
jgi:hypothetical protein